VGGHLVAPPDLAAQLPSLEQGFADFRAQVTARGKHAAFIGRVVEQLDDSLPAEFRRFVDGIDAEGGRTLDFAHVLLPHRPWRYLPDGRLYAGPEDPPGTDGRSWGDAPWAVAHGYQRHLLQVQLVDRLLGELLTKLHDEGIYDDALIVVVSDHGSTFAPGSPLRGRSRHSVSQVAPVPLLIKAPGQTRGRISDVPAETVDVFPTMLDLLGVEVPPDLDGRSLVDGAAVRRPFKRLHTLRGTVTFPSGGEEKWAALDRKLELFGAEDGSVDPYRVAPAGTDDLLGLPVRATATAQGMTVRLDDAGAYAAVDLEGPTIPALVSGTVTAPGAPGSAPPTLAIAVNGVIAAVTQADGDTGGGTFPFRAMIPPSALGSGRNDIAVLDAGPGGQLRRIPAH
jgi:hypothetical protein